MNKQPVYYMQTDSRWKNKDYSAKGESTTIGASGCGPTCAAMLIETLTGKTFTPVDACAWSLKNNYKAYKQGTYYSYFVPQFKEFGIDCRMLNNSNVYGNPSASVHKDAFDLLKQGYYVIACMGPGTWTKGGHYIVVWWQDGKVRINDPASKKTERLNGNINTFKSQVKYYWAIDAREYNSENTDSKIKEIQDSLNKKYNAGISVDGKWGPASKRALIKAMQKEIGAKVDGYFGPKTEALCPVLKVGAKGNTVWILQAALYVKGHDIAIDSSFGPATLSSVKLYQKNNKLSIDGKVGPITWRSLLK